MDAHHGISSREHDDPGRGMEDRHEPGPRVLVFDGYLAPEPAAMEALERHGYAVVRCSDTHTLLEEIVQRPPSVVVFGLRANGLEDLGLLHLVRRALPNVPLILIADKGSLETQRGIQSLRPIYYAMCPLDAAELGEAVESALEGRRVLAERRWMHSPRGLVGRGRHR